MSLPEGNGFVWIAAEARVARAVRDYLVNTRGHPLHWTKAAGYWLKGVADAVNQAVVLSVILLALANVAITQAYVMLVPQGIA